MLSSDPTSSHSGSSSVEEIALREAWFRAQAAREFLELKKTIKLQSSESESLRTALETRDTTIHQLYLARAEEGNRLRQAYKDLEEFTFLLQSAEESAQKWEAVRSSIFWRLIRPFWSAEKTAKRRSNSSRQVAREPISAGRFTYYLHTPPYRIYREGHFTFRGWAVPAEVGKKITMIRVRVDDQEYPGRYGLEDAEGGAHHTPENPNPGFHVDFATPAGRHQLALEISLGEAGWFSVFNIPIWVISDGSR